MSNLYVCSLDEATQKKALEELEEDPKNRQGAIETFREWILQQKHIKCPTDDVFLLAFLRSRVFSQLEARILLEKFLKRRQKLSEWYQDLDPCDPAIGDMMDQEFCTILPGRDKDGRKILYFNVGAMDVKKKVTCFRQAAMFLDYLHLCDEATQVHGSVTFVDCSGMTMAHQTRITIEEYKNFIGTWQKNFPARIKAIHFYKLGAFAEFIMMIAKLAMPEKIQKRMVIHGSSLENVYKYIPMEILPEEYLPDEYLGPRSGTRRYMIVDMKKTLEQPEIRARLRELSSKDVFIDLKQKDFDVPQQSFRKLNID